MQVRQVKQYFKFATTYNCDTILHIAKNDNWQPHTWSSNTKGERNF